MRIQRLAVAVNFISQYRLFSDFFPQADFTMAGLTEKLVQRYRCKESGIEFLGRFYSPESTPERNVFTTYVTGGGSSSISWIFSVPGASRCVMLACVPYATAATRKIVSIGDDLEEVESFVSDETALKMSYAARKSAAETLLQDTNSLASLAEANVIGLGLTAALVTNRPKAGPHRCIVSYDSGTVRGILSIDMTKGAREREDEDIVASRVLIEGLAKAGGVTCPVRDYLLDDEHITEQDVHIPEIIDAVRNCEVSKAFFIPIASKITAKVGGEDADLNDFKSYTDITLPANCLIYSGSFNPLHEGHIKLLLATFQKYRWSVNPEDPNGHPPVVFEIAAVNADKPPLSRDEVIRRIIQFSSLNPLLQNAGLINYCICVTSAPLFLAKSKLFRRCKFVIGVDTMTRILNPKYYGDSDEATVSMLSVFLERGCTFVVGGRSDLSGVFQTADEVLSTPFASRLPAHIRDMFTGLSQDEFRVDISSTEIRNKEEEDR
jgi:hypothetical protein